MIKEICSTKQFGLYPVHILLGVGPGVWVGVVVGPHEQSLVVVARGLRLANTEHYTLFVDAHSAC